MTEAEIAAAKKELRRRADMGVFSITVSIETIRTALAALDRVAPVDPVEETARRWPLRPSNLYL